VVSACESGNEHSGSRMTGYFLRKDSAPLSLQFYIRRVYTVTGGLIQ